MQDMGADEEVFMVGGFISIQDIVEYDCKSASSAFVSFADGVSSRQGWIEKELPVIIAAIIRTESTTTMI